MKKFKSWVQCQVPLGESFDSPSLWFCSVWHPAALHSRGFQHISASHCPFKLCSAVFVTRKKTFSFHVLLLNFFTFSLCSCIFIYPSLMYTHTFSVCFPVLKNTCSSVACLYLMIWGLNADTIVSFKMILFILQSCYIM